MQYYVSIDVNYLGQNSKVTFADIDVQIVDENMNEVYRKQVKETALRNYEDRADSLVGMKLALGRALESLGRSMQKSAWGEVTHRDKLRAKQPSKSRSSVGTIGLSESLKVLPGKRTSPKTAAAKKQTKAKSTT